MDKKILVLVIPILLVLTLSIISAMSQESYQKMDFFSKLKYDFLYGNIFTSWGQTNGCSINSDKDGTISSNQIIKCSTYCVGSGTPFNYNKCAIDIFTTSYQFVGEYKTGSYTNSILQNQIYEIYCCPQNPPTTDNHETTAYKCVNNAWVDKGDYGKTETCSSAGSANGNLCWCSDESDNFYIDKNGGTHCRLDSYSSVNDGTWCGTSGQCTSTQTKCESTTYYICSNNAWVSQGNVNGKCGYGGTTTCSSYTTQSTCNQQTGKCNWVLPGVCATIVDGTGNAKTITITQFYSLSNDDFLDSLGGCSSDNECGSVDGNYNITCIKSGSIYNQIQKRVYSSYKSQCEKSGLIKLTDWFTRFVVGFDVCDIFTNIHLTWDNFWTQYVKGNTGVCIAKSTTWYGGLWEQGLSLVGGLGIPYQYVVISLVGILLLLGSILINTLTK